MIIKVQDDKFKDKFLVEAAYIRWVIVDGDTILEVHIAAPESKTVGSVKPTSVSIEHKPSLRLRINHGDRVFIMNNEGKTVDSRRVEREPEAEAEGGKEEILGLIRAAWKRSPKENLLELLGSCFAAGDISGIDDDELKKNLVVLTEL